MSELHRIVLVHRWAQMYNYFWGFVCWLTEFQWRIKLAPRAQFFLQGVFLLPYTHQVVLLCLALTTYLWVSSASIRKEGVAVRKGISTFGWRGSLLRFTLHCIMTITKVKKKKAPNAKCVKALYLYQPYLMLSYKSYWQHLLNRKFRTNPTLRKFSTNM